MRVVWKYSVDLAPGVLTLGMPSGAEILHVAEQERGRGLAVWALCEPDVNEPEERRFEWHGTGHAIPDDGRRYVGTVLSRGFVWHLFELEATP